MRKKKRYHQFHVDNIEIIGKLVASDDEVGSQSVNKKQRVSAPENIHLT